MADPFTLATGVAGLIGLAEVIISKTWKYIVSCKKASKEAPKLLNEVRSLLGVLTSLDIVIPRIDEAALQTKIPLSTVLQCRTMLKDLQKTLEKADPGAAESTFRKFERTLKWPLDSSETKLILQEIERYKSTFDLILSMDTLEAVLDISSLHSTLSQEVSDIKQICKIIETSERNEILNFFGTFDPISNHEMSLQLHQPGTGLWLTAGSEFQTWTQQKNARLWLYGIPGAGKTVLAATAIRHILKAADADSETAAVYYYCDYKKEKSQELVNILASIAGQLARQSELCFKMLEKSYRSTPGAIPRHTLPDVEELKQLIINMCNYFQTVVVIVDAVDECSDPGDVTSGLISLISPDDSNIKTLLFSRNELDIRRHLDSFGHISIAAQRGDLELYVAAQLVERTKKGRLRPLSAELKAEILEHLVNHADGMFRWVACQLDHLYGLPTDKERRKALKKLPPDLNTTYARILQRVEARPSATSTMVQRVLWWLINDSTPALKADALCQAIAVEDEDATLEDDATPDVDAILEFCSSLVRLSVDGVYLELAHFTVKEYLRGSVLERDPLLKRYFFQATFVSAYKARTALTYLSMNHFDEPAKDWESYLDRKQKFPFYSTAVYWHKFLDNLDRESDNNVKLVKLMQELFSPAGSSNYSSWAQAFMLEETDFKKTRYYDRENDDDRDNSRMDTQVLLANTLSNSSQLHLACILGVLELVQWLLDTGCDVNEECGIGLPMACAMLQSRIFKLTFDSQGPVIHFEVYERGENGEKGEIIGDGNISRDKDGYNGDVVELLVKGNADESGEVRRAGSKTRSVFWLACFVGYGELLLNYDCRVDRATLQYLLTQNSSGRSSFDGIISKIQESHVQEADRDLFNELKSKTGCITEEFVKSLVSVADDTGLSDAVGHLLYEACTRNNVNIVKTLHAKYGQAVVSYRHANSGETPLLTAAHSDAKDVLMYVLEHGATLDERSSSGDTVLHKCVGGHQLYPDNRIDLLEFLLSNDADISITNEKGDAPIHVGARSGNVELLKVLLSHGADAFHTDNDDRTMYHIVVARDGVDEYRMLCERASTDERKIAHTMKDQDGMTLAHIAAISGHRVFAEMLVEDIASCPKSSDGRTLFHFAAMGTRHGVSSLKRLLELELADMALSHDGSTAAHELMLSITSENGRRQQAGWPVREAIDLLCEAGVDLTHPQEDGLTPLHILCQYITSNYQYFRYNSGRKLMLLGALKRLVTNGAHPFKRIGSQDSPLDIVLRGYEHERREEIRRTRRGIRGAQDEFDSASDYFREVLFGLIESVADSDLILQSYGGVSLLMWAINSGLDKLCMRLIEGGADLDVAKSTVSPLDVDIHDFDLDEEFLASLTSMETLCLWSGNEQVITQALARSTRALDRNGSGFNLLHLACMGNTWSTQSSATARAVIAKGIDVNQPIARQTTTALDIACALNNDALVKVLLQSGADPNIHGTLWGPIHRACFDSDKDIVTSLMPHVPAFYTISTSLPEISHQMLNLGPLELTCLDPETEFDLVQKLLDCQDRVKGRVDASALICACINGNTNLVRYLIEHGYSIEDEYSNEGMRPIHVAALGGHLDTVELLVENECLLDLKDSLGRSPVMLALKNGHNEVAKWLLSQSSREPTNEEREFSKAGWYSQGNRVMLSRGVSEGLEIIIRNGNLEGLRYLYDLGLPNGAYLACGSCSPLLFAVLWEQTAIANYLLDANASFKGKCCAYHAGPRRSANVCHVAASAPRMNGVLRRVMETPVFPVSLLHSRFRNGATPLDEAASSGNVEAINLILEHGGKVGSCDATLRTPLHSAAEQGNETAVRCLLAAGSKPNVFTSCLRTPAWLAACGGNFEALKVLYSAGADLSKADDQLESPLHIASRNGHLKVVCFLLSLGEALFNRNGVGTSAFTALLEMQNPRVVTFGLHIGALLDQDTLLWTSAMAPFGMLRRITRRYFAEDLVGDVNHRHKFAQTTPLYKASAANRDDTIVLLAETGALINLEGGSYGTPLMAACSYGRLAAVKVLVRLGAILSYKKNGIVFSAICAASSHRQIVRWLLVGRFTKSKLLCTASHANQASKSAHIDHEQVFQPTVRLCLDLVFAEESDKYLKALNPASTRLFICQFGDDNTILETNRAATGSTDFAIPHDRRGPHVRVATGFPRSWPSGF